MCKKCSIQHKMHVGEYNVQKLVNHVLGGGGGGILDQITRFSLGGGGFVLLFINVITSLY